MLGGSCNPCCGEWYCYCERSRLNVPCKGRSNGGSVFCGINVAQGPPYQRGSLTVWIDDNGCDSARPEMSLVLTENCINSIIETYPAYTKYTSSGSEYIPGYSVVPSVQYYCNLETTSSDQCHSGDAVKATWSRLILVLQLKLDSNGDPINKKSYLFEEFALLAAVRQTYAPVVAQLPDMAAGATTITLDATTITATYRDVPVFPSDYPYLRDPVTVYSDGFPYRYVWLVPGQWVSAGTSTDNIRESIFPTSLDSKVASPNISRVVLGNGVNVNGFPQGVTAYIQPALYTKTYRQMIDQAIAAVPAPTLTVPVTLSTQCA